MVQPLPAKWTTAHSMFPAKLDSGSRCAGTRTRFRRSLAVGRSTIFSVPPQVFWPYCAAIVSLAVAIAAFWKPVAQEHGRDKMRALAPAAYAIPLVVFGADHLSAVKEVMRVVPSWMPGKMFWTIFVGVALILAGFSILLGIQRRLSTTLLGIMFFLFEGLLHIPNLIHVIAGGHLFNAPGQRAVLGVAGRDFAFGCGAFLLAAAASRPDIRIRIGRYACRGMAVVALVFGFVHFWFPRFAPGVPLEKPNPDWMPGGPAWGYMIGAALILGAIGMLGPDTTRRRAAAILGTILVALVALFYVPIMFANPTVETLNYVADTLLFAASILIGADA